MTMGLLYEGSEVLTPLQLKTTNIWSDTTTQDRRSRLIRESSFPTRTRVWKVELWCGTSTLRRMERRGDRSYDILRKEYVEEIPSG